APYLAPCRVRAGAGEAPRDRVALHRSLSVLATPGRALPPPPAGGPTTALSSVRPGGPGCARRPRRLRMVVSPGLLQAAAGLGPVVDGHLAITARRNAIVFTRRAAAPWCASSEAPQTLTGRPRSRDSPRLGAPPGPARPPEAREAREAHESKTA